MRFALAFLLSFFAMMAPPSTLAQQKTKGEVVVPIPAQPQRPARITPAEETVAQAPQPIPPITVQVPPQPAPQVTVTAPPRSEMFDWIWSGLLGLIAVIFGTKTWGEWRAGVRGRLDDPAVKAAIDERIISVLESGVPGGVFSKLVPGGAFAEPFLRRMLVEVLEGRAERHREAAGVGDTTPVSRPEQEDDLLRRLLERLKREGLPPRLGHSGSGQG